MKCVFMRVKGNYLLPVDPYAEQLVERCKLGEGITVEARKNRNIGFHRKFFKLLLLGFDMWEPSADTRIAVGKDFNSFRAEVLIMAGHYEQVFTLDGNGFKLIAKSISFASIDDFKFEQVYKSVLTVIWEKILAHKGFKNQEAVDTMVYRLLGFE